MSETVDPEQHRLQFGLRKVLLWTAAVAFGLGLLSTLKPDALGWVVYPGWIATVLILRWNFGSKVAALASVAFGMLLFAVVCGLEWAANDMRPHPAEVVVIAVVCSLLGGMIGFVLLLLIETACRIINRLDRIGQSDG